LNQPNSSIRLIAQQTSQLGRHFQFEQLYQGVRIYGAYLRISLHSDGSFIQASEHLIQIPSDATVLSSANAPDYYLYADHKLIPLFRKGLSIINATGEVIKVLEDRFYLNNDDTLVSGKVFNHDPLTSSGHIYGQNGTWQHFNDSDYSLLNDQRVLVNFPATLENGKFLLKSQFAIVEDLDSPANVVATSTTPMFDFTRKQDGFKDVMVYYHVLHTRDYFMSLGFTSKLQYRQRMDSHSKYDDNSFFSTSDTTLNFGVGCIPDAEDGDVPCHEYTHAMSFDINPTPVMNGERRAIEEGLCDVTAAVQSYKTTTFNWRYLYNFDGPNPVYGGNSVCWGGRNGQSDKTYSIKNGNPYKDCEIWASCLLDIAEHAQMGHDTLMILMLNSIALMTQGTTMPQAAQMMLDTDSLLFDGRHKLLMGYFFNRREFGIFPESVESIHSLPSWFTLYNSLGFALGEGQLIIHHTGEQPYQLMIYDINGKEIFTGSISNGDQEITPDHFNSGLYVIKILEKGNCYTQKLVRF
jgi:hypothetical protein